MHVSRAITWLIVPLLIVAGCGQDKKPTYTTVPIIGYPYPFGVNVKNLLGKSRWKITSWECAVPYYIYHVSGSQWSEYSQVVLIADTLGTLQAFSATRPFSGDAEAQAFLDDTSSEIWRRYGAQTDSTVERTRVLARIWRDASGSSVSVSATNGGVMVKAASGRIGRDCPAFLDAVLAP